MLQSETRPCQSLVPERNKQNVINLTKHTTNQMDQGQTKIDHGVQYVRGHSVIYGH